MIATSKLDEDWMKLVDKLIREGILKSSKVIRAFKKVPRYLFLPEKLKPHAAVDTPLPIGHGQTVSAPHMVAIMDEALELEVGHKVLEVGSGSGWHATTIAEIVAPSDIPKEEWGHVYTIEIVPYLVEMARENIKRAGYADRITVIHGDGSCGYIEEAPYDRIIVTAAAPDIPKPLIEQLRVGGVLLIPVGSISFFQTLIRLRKENGKKIEDLGGVAFVPLVGKYGFKI